MPAEADDLIAHPFGKLADMGLPFIQPKLCLEPDVDLPFFHVPALPQLFQCPVRQNALVPEISICQSSHRPVRPVMGAHIGIAGRPAVAEIEKFPLGPAVQAVNHAGRAERGIGMAIRTFDLFLLHHKIITSKDAPKAARWRLSV